MRLRPNQRVSRAPISRRTAISSSGGTRRKLSLAQVPVGLAAGPEWAPEDLLPAEAADPGSAPRPDRAAAPWAAPASAPGDRHRGAAAGRSATAVEGWRSCALVAQVPCHEYPFVHSFPSGPAARQGRFGPGRILQSLLRREHFVSRGSIHFWHLFCSGTWSAAGLLQKSSPFGAKIAQSVMIRYEETHPHEAKEHDLPVVRQGRV